MVCCRFSLKPIHLSLRIFSLRQFQLAQPWYLMNIQVKRMVSTPFGVAMTHLSNGNLLSYPMHASPTSLQFWISMVELNSCLKTDGFLK